MPIAKKVVAKVDDKDLQIQALLKQVQELQEKNAETVEINPGLPATNDEFVSVKKADLTFHNVKVKKQIIQNNKGEDVPLENYFFVNPGETIFVPNYFNDAFGKPTDREDLIEIFDTIFKPEDNFILLKDKTKEVYNIMVPLKFSNEVNFAENSQTGDCQIHAISFITDGSVNHDKFKSALKKISSLIAYGNK